MLCTWRRGRHLDEQGFLRAALSDDGLHPNANGYAVMAPLAEQAIAAVEAWRIRTNQRYIVAVGR